MSERPQRPGRGHELAPEVRAEHRVMEVVPSPPAVRLESEIVAAFKSSASRSKPGTKAAAIRAVLGRLTADERTQLAERISERANDPVAHAFHAPYYSTDLSGDEKAQLRAFLAGESSSATGSATLAGDETSGTLANTPTPPVNAPDAGAQLPRLDLGRRSPPPREEEERIERMTPTTSSSPPSAEVAATTRLEAQVGDGGASKASDLAHLGRRIAAMLSDVHYEGDGVFRVGAIRDHAVIVEILRTSADEPRSKRTAGRVVVELPRGLSEAQLERAMVGKLAEIRDDHRGAAIGERGPAGPRGPTRRRPRADEGGTIESADSESLSSITSGPESEHPRPGDHDSATIHDGAATANGESLPFQSQIQTQFGRHDVAGIRAHTGDAAGTAAAGLGARAFARGNDVVFAGTPDLHTAAHEAAHVVQQRRGASDDDEHERHADEVADAVVEGRSAEDLLDGFAGPGSQAGPVVQRKELRRVAPTSASASASTAPRYVEVNRGQVLTAIANRLIHTSLTQPHPRLRWSSMDQGPFLVAAAIRAYVDQVPNQTLKQLMKLSATTDLEALVDEVRGGRSGMDWMPAVGTAIGIAFDEAMQTSIDRVGARVRALIDRDGSLPRASAVLASSPLDGVIAGLLTTPGNVLFDPSKHGAAGGDKAAVQTEAREVTFEWVKDEPSMWNWIRVTAPVNANANDVAHTPLVGGEVKDGSEQAYRIAANPPFFGIPIETAKLVPEVLERAPVHVKQQLANGDLGPRVVTSEAFLESQLSDEMALAHAPHHKAKDAAVDRTLPRIQEQLGFMRMQLDPWNVTEPLFGATRFADRRHWEIAGDPRKAAQWQTTLAAQEELLHGVSSELAEFLESLIAQGAKPKDAPALQPVIRVLKAYAEAAGASHLPAAAVVALAEARKLRAMLPLSFVDEQVRLTQATTGEYAPDAATVHKPETEDAKPETPDLATRAADLRLRVMRGQDVDPDAVALVGVDADETTVRSRIAAMRSQLAVITDLANDVGITRAAYQNGLPTLHALAEELGEHRIPHWIELLDKAAAPNKARIMIETRRHAIADVSARMRAFDTIDNIEGKPGTLQRWAKWAKDEAHNQQLHNALVSLAIQMGVMIVTGQIATGVLAGARAAWLGAAFLTEVRGAGLAYKAAEILLHSGLATLAQGLVGGEEVGGADIAENAVAMILSNAAMKPFQSLLHGDAVLEKQIETWAKLGTKTGKVAVEIALETGTGIAASHVARSAVKGGSGDSMADAQEWISQGISIGASRFVAVRVQKMRDRLAKAKAEAVEAHAQGSGDPAAFESLLAEADAVGKRAQKSGSSPPSIEEARTLLVDSTALLLKEKPLHQARVAAAASHHPDAKALVDRSGNAADLAGLGPEFADVPFQLAHLSPVVDGHVYEGTAAQISLAFETADKTLRTKPIRVLDPNTGIWHVAIEGRVITVRDRALAAKAAGGKTVKMGASHAGPPVEEGEVRHAGKPASEADTKRTHNEEEPVRSRPDETPVPDSEATRRVVLSGDDGEVRAAADRVKPKAGYIDVIVHGDANSFLVIREHADVQIDHRALATYMAKHGLTGQKIRLIACESGLTPFAVAQHLSNKLGVEVLAPTTTAWIDGQGNVGVGPRDQHEGGWHPFTPKAVASDGTKTPMRVPEPPHVPFAPSAPEIVPPLDVRFDHRERYSATNHDELQAKLGKMLEVDPRMTDGVRIEVERQAGVFGVNYEVKRVAIGRGALAADVVAHAEMIRLIERYNGAVGKLRKVWDHLRGTSGKTFDGSRYPHGSRGWVLANEIEKIGNHIAATQLVRDHGQLDANQASQEIAFLAGTDAYFREQLRTLAPGEQDPLFDVSRPDVGETTREAEAAGYKRPGQPGATIDGATLDPEAYYYRRSQSDPSRFELARKPGANAPELRARVVGGKFIGIEVPVEAPALKLSEIPSGKELETLYAPTGSMAPYAEMIERAGIASKAVIDFAALSFHRSLSQKSNATIDDWRHAVKERFHERLIDKLADPKLDAAASYQQMRQLVDGLGNSDRGSLVEAWYRARFAPTAEARRAYEVTRTGGSNAGKTEKRVTDLIVGREIREVKDIEGPIDYEQFGSYADLLRDESLRETMGVDKLRYVFTKPKGAIANLEFLARQMGAEDLRGRLSVEVFDERGKGHELHTKAQAVALLATLKAGR